MEARALGVKMLKGNLKDLVQAGNSYDNGKNYGFGYGDGYGGGYGNGSGGGAGNSENNGLEVLQEN
jgi:hypothetical protein